MKNLNEAFGLDNIPDELKTEAMKQTHTDTYNGMDDFDRSISVIATLAAQIHEKVCGLVCQYVDMEKSLGNGGEKYVTEKETLAAIMCAGYVLAHGCADSKAEAMLDLAMATQGAMVIGPTVIKAVEALRTGDLKPGSTLNRDGMIFYSIPKQKKS